MMPMRSPFNRPTTSGMQNKKARSPRVTTAQKQHLLNYMKRDRQLGFEGGYDDDTDNERWNILSNQLNAMGGAKKSVAEWKEVSCTYFLTNSIH